MRVYVGIDMAKDKFDYCTVDDDMNILYRGNNCSNSSESFDSLKKNIEYLKSITTSICIGMESTGIYHLPLYRYLRDSGFHVRILNGLEVRGMKKSRVRKTTNDSIDSESIARYTLIPLTGQVSLPMIPIPLRLASYTQITCNMLSGQRMGTGRRMLFYGDSPQDI